MYKKFNIKKAEAYLFYFTLFAGLIPLFVFRFFPTLDGPAHLYNSNLIIELFKENRQIAQIFSLNNFSIPNWSGHAILAFFNFFLPAFIAEKILIGIYLIGLPLAFRLFIKQLKGDIVISWLIFPFTFSFMFYMGFYNFCLGTLFFFLGLYAWLKNMDKPLKSKLLILVFSILIFYSHIVVFAIFVLTLFCLLICDFYSEVIIIKKPGLKKYVIKAIWLGVALFPAGIAGLIYILSHSSPNEGSRIDSEELLRWLFCIQSLVVFNVNSETIFTICCFGLILFLVLASVSMQLYQKIKKTKQLNSNPDLSIIWLILAGMMLVLYFILPDEVGSGGYISGRLNWFFFIFLIFWLSTKQFQPWIRILTVCLVLFVHAGLLFHHNIALYRLNRYTSEVMETSKYIPPNSVVLPLNFSDNWSLNHFSNYMGTDKPLIILENYEAAMGYFPVIWNDKSLPLFYFEGDDSLKYCDFIRESQNSNTRKVDYLFFIGNYPDTSKACIRNILNYSRKNSTLVYHSTNTSLYKCGIP